MLGDKEREKGLMFIKDLKSLLNKYEYEDQLIIRNQSIIEINMHKVTGYNIKPVKDIGINKKI